MELSLLVNPCPCTRLHTKFHSSYDPSFDLNSYIVVIVYHIAFQISEHSYVIPIALFKLAPSHISLKAIDRIPLETSSIISVLFPDSIL